MTVDPPSAAVRLEKKAHEHGWTTSVHGICGTINGNDVWSIAVRLRRGDQRLVALWEDGKFRTALRAKPLGKLNSRELAAVVTS
jgi:hypothetical protein